MVIISLIIIYLISEIYLFYGIKSELNKTIKYSSLIYLLSVISILLIIISSLLYKLTSESSEKETIDLTVNCIRESESKSLNYCEGKYCKFYENLYPGFYKVGKPYSINGTLYTPKEYKEYNSVGVASYYGKTINGGGHTFQGKLTANGEIYNMYDLTGAHPTLPLPSIVRVTNLENNKSVIIRVNDRGPFKNNREIDLSVEAFKKIANLSDGLVRVSVTLLKEESDYVLRLLKLQK